MRTKNTIPLLLVGLLLCGPLDVSAQANTPPTTNTTTTASANVGQTITLSGTAYKVNAKKVLASGVEYYTVKATISKAPTKYFLRSENVYNPTIFTQAQYEAFMSTGKLSSFGTLKKITVDGRNVNYVTKGSTIALLATSAGVLGIREYIGSAETIKAMVSGGFNQSIGQCKERCDRERAECDKTWPPSPPHEDSDICWTWWMACKDLCERDPMAVPPLEKHVIRSSRPILFQ